VWVGAAKLDVGPLAAARLEARRAAENEHRRLLYVGMSRAADRLIVCGAEGERSRPAGCWYDLVSDALKPVASEEAERDGDKVWRLQKFTDEQAELPLGARASPDGEAIRLPPWLTRAAPKEPSDRILHPSIALNGDEPMLATVGQDGNRQQALVHGVLLHRLMQSLPDIPAAEREAAARRFLARSASEFDEANREDILAHALGILADPRFAPLAGENSRAEVPIAGRIAPSLARSSSPALFVSGQVDRLAVTETEVLIADYKTNRPAPRTLSEVPEAYVAQLALYRAVLAQTFPDRPVRALLVWTQVPDFMDIPGPALDAALSAVLSR
jgi:ATP-dependent helicase/nuclease subunit A